MHPDIGAAVLGAIVRLVLRDLVRVVDLAMVNAAGVDIEFFAEIFVAHLGAFEVPARCALAPGAVPFHLPRLASGSLAPDREVLRVTFAFDRIDPALDIIALGTGEPTIIGHRADIKIESAFQLVAMFVGDAFGESDHLFDMVGGDRPFGRLTDIQPLDVLPVGVGVIFGDIPGGLARSRRRLFHLVIAGIGVGGQMADIGNIDDMG